MRPGAARPFVFGAPASAGKFTPVPPPSTLLFGAFTGDSGNVNLSESVTINSVTISPSWSYRAEDISGTSWPSVGGAGPSLAIANTGTAPSTGRYPPVTKSTERSVLFNNAQVYQASDKTLQIGTEDFLVEALVRAPLTGGSTSNVCGQRNGFGTNGWFFGFNNPTTVVATCGTGSVLSTPCLAGAWHLVHMLVNRDSTTGWNFAVNGVLGTAASATPFNSSLATGNFAFTMGGTNDFATKGTAEVAFVRVYKSSNWFAGGTTDAAQWAAFVKQRMAQLSGAYATTSAGGIFVPTTMTRTTAATLDRVVSTSPTVCQALAVGPNWPRLAKRENAAGGTFVMGALQENGVSNLALQSETFDNASWTKVSGSVTANTTVAPSGDTTADSFIANTGTGTRGVSQGISLGVSPYTFSVWVKAGAATKVALGNTTISNALAWFDLSAGTVLTKQAGILGALIIPYGNGWYRCAIRYTAVSATNTHVVYAASADASTNFTGDGSTTSMTLWGAQVELDFVGMPSSYILTTTGSLSRGADTLEYDITGSFEAPGNTFVAQCDFMSRDFDLQQSAVPFFVSNTSANNNNAVFPLINATGDVPTLTLNVGGAQQWGTGGQSDCINGEKHTLRAEVASHNAVLFIDGNAVDINTSDALPTQAMTYLRVGARDGGNAPYGGLVANLKFF